ncbi:sensor histidine kinase [Fertoebacter nigrum]|uniref:Sensor histidine kinase n=1 Tax=Fertoeibacter niger TaxID=2656921 RepID=A0A8X8KPE9_9RHOB|nr:ATP-binding protein [Fertoeibacter niger]NUB45045.1 sensor histidine kinase [Fertoeibacter niger]
MTTLNENLKNRIRKLMKPANQAQALQPFFEAVSNAVMAVEDLELGDVRDGTIEISITGLGGDNVEIAVLDRGIGLDPLRFEAFCQIDTEFKKDRGGKGVGRLYWLDAFRKIEVESQYRDEGGFKQRAFDFRLTDVEQIVDKAPKLAWRPEETGTMVRFEGLSLGPYKEHFSKTAETLKNYLAAEFIAPFLSGNSPQIKLTLSAVAGKPVEVFYPSAVSQLVIVGPEPLGPIELPSGENLTVKGFLCDAKASRGLDGKHQVHLLGNGRTIQSRKVDDLLGISQLEHEGAQGLTLHLIVQGDFLDQRTTESRTAFTIPEDELKAIVKAVVTDARKNFIADQVKKFDDMRRATFQAFLREQPIFAYGDTDEIFTSLPVGATTPEAYAQALVVPRMRAEKNRETVLTNLVNALVSGKQIPEDFSKIVIEAAGAVQENERTSLAHHAARRRVVLDLLDQLIRRVRKSKSQGEDVYHLEKTLHSLLVPMRRIGTDPGKWESAGHDLWIVDERLAFTSSFASDLPLREFVIGSELEDRPDIVLWDVGFSLGAVDEVGGIGEVDDARALSEVFIVELKHPGRENYGKDERIEDQVRKYAAAIMNSQVESFGRRRIKVSKDCQFHCLVVADFLGRLGDEVSGWDPIYNERGRQRRLGGKFAGVTIEAVEWDYVLDTARTQNRALLSAAGLQKPGKTKFVRHPEPDQSKEDADASKLLTGATE